MLRAGQVQREGKGIADVWSTYYVPGALLHSLPLILPAVLGGRCSDLHLWAWKVTDALPPFPCRDPCDTLPQGFTEDLGSGLRVSTVML